TLRPAEAAHAPRERARRGGGSRATVRGGHGQPHLGRTPRVEAPVPRRAATARQRPPRRDEPRGAAPVAAGARRASARPRCRLPVARRRGLDRPRAGVQGPRPAVREPRPRVCRAPRDAPRAGRGALRPANPPADAGDHAAPRRAVVLTHELRIAIRWRDVDALRHVNNAVYATYLEECRDGWLEHALGDDASLEDYVLARVAIDFRSEVSLGEEAVLACATLVRIGTSSLTLREEIRKLDGTLAPAAQTGSGAQHT